MKRGRKIVSTRQVGARNSAGLGRIILPQNYDRADYIRRCLRLGSLSLMPEDGGIIDNVAISKHLFNYLEFPANSDELGSQVVWLNTGKENNVIAIGVINRQDELVAISEKQAVLSREGAGGYVEVGVDGKTGRVVITARGKEKGQGNLLIDVSNPKEDAQVELRVKGDVKANVKGNIEAKASKKFLVEVEDPFDEKANSASISYDVDLGFVYEDDEGNKIEIDKGVVRIAPKDTFEVGSGKEALLLGDTTQKKLQALTQRLDLLIATLSAAVPVPSDGGLAVTKQVAAAFASNPKGPTFGPEIKSKTSKTD